MRLVRIEPEHILSLACAGGFLVLLHRKFTRERLSGSLVGDAYNWLLIVLVVLIILL